MEFQHYLDEEQDDVYKIKYKYKKQTIIVKIYCFYYQGHIKNEVSFRLDVQIKNKNKNKIGYMETTGRYGISELIIIKNIILEFINQVEKKDIRLPDWIERDSNKIYLMHISWSNAKRKRAYKRLEKYGFTFKNDRYEKEIIINKGEC